MSRRVVTDAAVRLIDATASTAAKVSQQALADLVDRFDADAAESNTRNDCRNAPAQEDMMADNLDRVVTSVVTHLMQATARTAAELSEQLLAHLVKQFDADAGFLASMRTDEIRVTHYSRHHPGLMEGSLRECYRQCVAQCARRAP